MIVLDLPVYSCHTLPCHCETAESDTHTICRLHKKQTEKHSVFQNILKGMYSQQKVAKNYYNC